mmetsp:Transcript_2844/g.5708  ORF Transcript_2844/g.5708 Transcript_2844/m.5708 type:complete len:302 (+) Transcript_2844:565-1470(+)
MDSWTVCWKVKRFACSCLLACGIWHWRRAGAGRIRSWRQRARTGCIRSWRQRAGTGRIRSWAIRNGRATKSSYHQGSNGKHDDQYAHIASLLIPWGRLDNACWENRRVGYGVCIGNQVWTFRICHLNSLSFLNHDSICIHWSFRSQRCQLTSRRCSKIGLCRRLLDPGQSFPTREGNRIRETPQSRRRRRRRRQAGMQACARGTGGHPHLNIIRCCRTVRHRRRLRRIDPLSRFGPFLPSEHRGYFRSVPRPFVVYGWVEARACGAGGRSPLDTNSSLYRRRPLIINTGSCRTALSRRRRL